jgi:flagellar hook-associated protein 3
MRVTSSMMVKNMLDHLKNNMRDLNDLNEQLSSGKLFQKPSDAPIKVSDSMNYKSQLNRNDQYQRNLNQAENWLNTTESALKSSTKVVQRAKELTIYAANDSVTSDDREKIASEIKELRDELIDISRSELGDSYIFSGQKTGVQPFNVNGSSDYVEYQGDKEIIERRLNENVEMDINLNAQDVFEDEINTLNNLYNQLSGQAAKVETSEFANFSDLNNSGTFEIQVDNGAVQTVDLTGESFGSWNEVTSFLENEIDGVTVEENNNRLIFKSEEYGEESVIKITDTGGVFGEDYEAYGSEDSYSGEEISANLRTLENSIDKYAELRAEIGGKLKRTDNIKNRLEAGEIHLKSLKSQNEDADLAEVITNLKMKENVYRASLASGARIMQQSLVDFIR